MYQTALGVRREHISNRCRDPNNSKNRTPTAQAKYIPPRHNLLHQHHSNPNPPGEVVSQRNRDYNDTFVLHSKADPTNNTWPHPQMQLLHHPMFVDQCACAGPLVMVNHGWRRTDVASVQLRSHWIPGSLSEIQRGCNLVYLSRLRLWYLGQMDACQTCEHLLTAGVIHPCRVASWLAVPPSDTNMWTTGVMHYISSILS